MWHLFLEIDWAGRLLLLLDPSFGGGLFTSKVISPTGAVGDLVSVKVDQKMFLQGLKI